MIHYVYTSTATVVMNDDALLDLLQQSRDRNKKYGITGMLLYVGGCFMQVLEGERSDVEAIYASIIEDDRNYGNILLLNEEITERTFPSWSMGFVNLDEDADYSHIEGLNNFIPSKMDKETLSNATLVVDLLYQFKENNQ